MRKLATIVMVFTLGVSLGLAQNEGKTQAAPAKNASAASSVPNRALAQKSGTRGAR